MFCQLIFRLAGVIFLSLVNMKYGLTLHCLVTLGLLQASLFFFPLPLHVELAHESVTEEPEEKHFFSKHGINLVCVTIIRTL